MYGIFVLILVSGSCNLNLTPPTKTKSAQNVHYASTNRKFASAAWNEVSRFAPLEEQFLPPVAPEAITQGGR